MTTVPAPYNDLHTSILGGAAPEAPMDAITRVAWNWIQSTEQEYPWKDWISTHVLGTIGIAGWALESVNSLEESIRLGHTGMDLHPFIGQSWVWERTGQTVGRLRRRRG